MFHLLKKTVQPIKILFNSNKNNIIKPSTIHVSSIPNRQHFLIPNKVNINYLRTFHSGLTLQGRNWTIFKGILKSSTMQNNCSAPGKYNRSGFLELIGAVAIIKWTGDFLFKIYNADVRVLCINDEESAMKVVSEESNFVKIHQEFILEVEKCINRILMYRAASEGEKRTRVRTKMEMIENLCNDENSREFNDATLQHAVSIYKNLQKTEWKVLKFLENMDQLWDRFSSTRALRKMEAKQDWINYLRAMSMILDEILKDYDELVVMLAHIKL